MHSQLPSQVADQNQQTDSDAHERAIKQDFTKLLIAQWFTKLADATASAKTVLPWLLTSAGAPAFIIGLLVPIRESGALIPQLIIGGFIRQHARRKWFYVLANVAQAGCVSLIAIAFLLLDGLLLGLSVLLLLVLLSLGRAVASIANKDVIGRTIPKDRRGRLNGLSASLAGITGLLVALIFWMTQSTILTVGIGLLALAAMSWVLAAVLSAKISEPTSEPGDATGGFQKAWQNLSLFRSDPLFKRFVITRALLMTSGLGLPFIVVKATGGRLDTSILYFMVATAVASLISGTLWGKLADRSSKHVILLSAAISCGIFVTTAFVSLTFSAEASDVKLFSYLGLYFLLAFAHQGTRLGRKTYLLNMAEGNARTDYVSVSNTAIGLLLIVFGFVSAAIAQWSLTYVMFLFTLSSMLAIATGASLKEVE